MDLPHVFCIKKLQKSRAEPCQMSKFFPGHSPRTPAVSLCIRLQKILARTLWYVWGGGYYDTGMSEGEDIMILVCLRGRKLWYWYVWGEDIMILVCLRGRILWYWYVWGGGYYDTGMSEGEDIMILVCLRGGNYDTGMSEGEDIMIPVCLRGRILWYRYVWGGGYYDTGMSEGEDIMIPVCLRGRILWYRYVWVSCQLWLGLKTDS